MDFRAGMLAVVRQLFVALLLVAGLLGQAAAEGNVVAAADLPPQARETLALIAAGGPFPYSRDGIVFGNYEKRLPLRNRGYYREYTVPTPGTKGRGARRIVAGEGGERYYTDDHYRSFRRIRE
ncbi:MAG: ribonuclease [Sterolibacteriaceae bacterium MAG5]|nr:ribonuclease [Candidatus Nitricoxidireducens bremensis]